jgi:hypothetical protein
LEDAALRTSIEWVAAVVLHGLKEQFPRLLKAWCWRRDESRTVIIVANADQPARPEDASDFQQGSAPVTQMQQQGMGEGGIKRFVRIGKPIHVPDLEADVRHVALGCERTSALNLCRLEVDSDDLAWRYDFRESNGDGPWSTTEVEHAHAGPEMGQEEGGGRGRRSSLQSLLLE